jgi:hypothetical protein
MSDRDVSNLNDTIVPKSDQLNADQLIGGPMTIRVTAVRRGSGDDQPVTVHYEGENGRPYKPCLTMRKVLIFAWGEDGEQWVGRMMTLYNRRDVKWGGVEVGGIRISHMSHVEGDIKLSLAATRGKKEPIIIKRLDASDPLQDSRAKMDAAARAGMDALKQAWSALSVDHKHRLGGKDGCPESYKTVAKQVDAAREAEKREPVQNPAERITASEVRSFEDEHGRAIGPRPAPTQEPTGVSQPAHPPYDPDNPF